MENYYFLKNSNVHDMHFSTHNKCIRNSSSWYITETITKEKKEKKEKNKKVMKLILNNKDMWS